MMSGAARRALIALGAVLMMATSGSTQERGGLSALDQLQPGRWELRELDNPRAVPRSICIADPAVLVQLEHRGKPCSRLVIANEAKSATVHYTCPTGGFGRTTVRTESSRLATVDTQGIRDNMPFDYRTEARRKGACAARSR